MFISELINIICSFVAVIVTIIIAVLQIRQSKRMAEFEKRQDERDEERHAEEVNAKAVSFISKYYADRGLIPLCAIGAMYNKLYYYSREMYREYCCFTKEVQNKILEYCDLDFRIVDEDIYTGCIENLEKIVKKRFSNDKNIFYDNAKYLERSLVSYGNNMISDIGDNYKEQVTNILAETYRENKYWQCPITQLTEMFDFGNAPEIDACLLATLIGEYIAIYEGDNIENDKEYGCPGGYSGETIDTMEDLFLKALFEIYTNLVL